MIPAIVTGGVEGGRALNQESAFETSINRRLGESIRRSDCAARDLWSALTNIQWRHDSGSTVLYSFRAAGDLVAAVRGEGDYLEWYCCGPDRDRVG